MFSLAVGALHLFRSASSDAHGSSGNPVLHVGYAYDSCYIDLHPELTAGQFKAFAREFSDAGAFVPMAGARSLAPWKVGIGLTYNQTFIDDSKPQWNNTFSHPGADHWLGQPALPILQARIGLPRSLETELMVTGDPESNWAIAGAALRVPLLVETPAIPLSASLRMGYLHLFGADELDLDAVSMETLVSRTMGIFTPYVGVGGVVAHGSEHTEELSLGSTTAFSARATVGLEIAIGRFRIAGQGMLASVNSLALMLGGVI
jgi:hypothetical protein